MPEHYYLPHCQSLLARYHLHPPSLQRRLQEIPYVREPCSLLFLANWRFPRDGVPLMTFLVASKGEAVAAESRRTPEMLQRETATALPVVISSQRDFHAIAAVVYEK